MEMQPPQLLAQIACVGRGATLPDWLRDERNAVPLRLFACDTAEWALANAAEGGYAVPDLARESVRLARRFIADEVDGAALSRCERDALRLWAGKDVAPTSAARAAWLCASNTLGVDVLVQSHDVLHAAMTSARHWSRSSETQIVEALSGLLARRLARTKGGVR